MMPDLPRLILHDLLAENVVLILSVIKTITVLVGAGFLVIAVRAYRRHRSRPLFVLILAVGLMTLATIAEGAAFQTFGFTLDQAHVIEGVFMLTAFLVLLWSVAVPDRRRFRVPREAAPPEDGPASGDR